MSIRALRIRAASPEDADGIAAVHTDSWRETYSGLIPDRYFDATALEHRRRMWAHILRLDPAPGRIVVAERDGRVAGFAFAGSAQHPDARKNTEPARDLHLFSIYLLADEHGAGAGHALLEATIGQNPAQLWVIGANEHARRFYERHGFEPDGCMVEDPELNGIVEFRMVR
ncbi:GNAT family N-acetyltransferase [Microbacterium hydrocarbonoxydans]|nr:GNAT family N-acetyltransferase [Microbacterium hydrocarbonoxydans]